MKKLLLIVLCFPTIGFGQDVPLTEKMVSTEAMENKDQKLRKKYDNQVRKKNNKRTRKSNQRSAEYLMYNLDNKSPIGISFGYIDKKFTGYYLNLKLHPAWMYKGWGVIYKIDNQGFTDANPSSGWSCDQTGNIKKGNIALSGGITHKIIYPVWAYLGAGLGYFPQYDEVNQSLYGDLYETYWMRNTDESRMGGWLEGGIKLKISSDIVLKYGIGFNVRGGIYDGIPHQFGLGFQF